MRIRWMAVTFLLALPATVSWSQVPDVITVGEPYGNLFSPPDPIDVGLAPAFADAAKPRKFLFLGGYTASGVGNSLSSTFQVGFRTTSKTHPLRVRANYTNVAISHLPNRTRLSGNADLLLWKRDTVTSDGATIPLVVVVGVVDASHTRQGANRYSGIAVAETYRGNWTGTVNLGWSVNDPLAGSNTSDATLGLGTKLKVAPPLKILFDFSFANDIDKKRSYTVGLEAKLPVKTGAPKLIVKVNRDQVFSANLLGEF